MYRQEHPKPQFERKDWINLNGTWEFEMDNGLSGLERGLSAIDATFSQRIEVPFCPESKKSGIGYQDFILGVWYKRTVNISPEKLDKKALLHFGAVDYECIVFVNGKEVGKHKGGFVSFSIDITDAVKAGDNVITVFAKDDTRDPMVPSGKQCHFYHTWECFYKRSTGIWQTVWIEFVPKENIKSVKFDTTAATGTVVIETNVEGCNNLITEISFDGKQLICTETKDAQGRILQSIQLPEKHLWEVGCGNLYDVVLRFGEDEVKSYFGLRDIRLEKTGFYINDKVVFQRLILDQGMYPDVVYTAETDEALAKDIDISMAMGFNGARLHEKIFEERFLYHCDKKGYIVWGEYPSWGLDHSRPEAIYSFLPEWIEEIKRDYNHPSIIGWCPFNETWDKNGMKQYDDLIRMAYVTTKAIDPYRPCIDTSGCFHVQTDIFDVHDYSQKPEVFRQRYSKLSEDGKIYDGYGNEHDEHFIDCSGRQVHNGEPIMLSEYGGIHWESKMDSNNLFESWGYGENPKSEEEFLERFKGLTDALLDNPDLIGFCYTELADVEQERNGLHDENRIPKFNPDTIKSIIGRKAAIEER